MPVVDASVVIDWVAPGVGNKTPAMITLRRLGAENAGILAPRLLLEEVANALVTGIRRRRWTGAVADDAYDMLRRLPVRIVDTTTDLDRAWDLARRYDDHPVYDMMYVAVAERVQTTLITADDVLRRRLKQLAWVVAPDRA
jgi:predicted nucleic acid-binding protein